MTIALVSDTHGLLRPEVVDALAGVERILHMGDVGGAEVWEALQAIAPVMGVRGNVDYEAWAQAALPDTAVLDVFGKTAYLLHNLARLDIDPAAAGMDYVFYGHTHKPADDMRDGVRYVNPGSIGPRRFTLPVSYALIESDRTLRFVEVEA